MMNYRSRLSLAVVIGIGMAVVIDYFYGNLYQWLFICVAISIATETAQRTFQSSSPYLSRKIGRKVPKFELDKNEAKPPKFKF